MYRIAYCPDKNSDVKVAGLAVEIYPGTYEIKIDGEWKKLNGIWIKLFNDSKTIFIHTDNADTMFDKALTMGYLDLVSYKWKTYISN